MASPVGHLVRARSMLSNVVYDLPRAERVHLARSDVHEKAAAFGAKIDREVFNLTVVGPSARVSATGCRLRSSTPRRSCLDWA